MKPARLAVTMGWAVASVAIATLLKILAGPALADPDVLFFAAVALVAWRVGTLAGALTILLSLAAQARFFVALDGPAIAVLEQSLGLFAWALEAALVCIALHSVNASRARVAALRDGLEDEIRARTAALFKESTERARIEEQLRQSQKMDALGRLAGGVAHDFNNLLSVILTLAELGIESPPEGAELREAFVEIGETAERAAALTRQLLLFSRQQPTKPTHVDVGAVVGELEKMLRRVVGEDIAITLDVATSGVVVADPGALEQVVMNLVVNARDAMPAGGALTIRVDRAPIEGDDPGLPGEVVLTVTDTGTGMDDATQARIFEPFFTTKGVGKGTGLGLATVYGIVQQIGGRVAVTSALGDGTTFRVYLPESEARASATDVGAISVITPCASTKTVLLVEDEPAVRSVARTALRRAGYAVLEAATTEEAIAVASDHDAPIDVLLTDVVLPGRPAREMIRQIVADRPDVVVVCMSGFNRDAVLRRGIEAGEIPFVEKPFTGSALTATVHASLKAAAVTARTSASA